MSYRTSNTPDYVKNIQGPMRKYYVNKERAARELLFYNVQGRPAEYNAFDRDFAIINVFFGDANTIGRTYYRSFKSFHHSGTYISQNTRDTRRRLGLTSYRPSEDFVASFLDSAFYPSQRLSIGSLWFGFAELFGEDKQQTRKCIHVFSANIK